MPKVNDMGLLTQVKSHLRKLPNGKVTSVKTHRRKIKTNTILSIGKGRSPQQNKSIARKQADDIERKDSQLWRKLNITSGTDLENNPVKKKMYEREMKAWARKKYPSGLSSKTYLELEDDNYHSANKVLFR